MYKPTRDKNIIILPKSLENIFLEHPDRGMGVVEINTSSNKKQRAVNSQITFGQLENGTIFTYSELAMPLGNSMTYNSLMRKWNRVCASYNFKELLQFKVALNGHMFPLITIANPSEDGKILLQERTYKLIAIFYTCRFT